MERHNCDRGNNQQNQNELNQDYSASIARDLFGISDMERHEC